MSHNPFVPVLNSVRRVLGLDPASQSADALLLERFALSKDEGAFAALVERHAALVWGVCRRVTGDAHAAEDAFQATWLVLSRKAGSLRDGAALPAWLHRVAYRLALRARATPAAALEDAPTSSSGPEDEVALRETRELIDEEVDRLPERYRRPVVLCFYEGRTHAEAAAELGLPIGTVASRVSRARELLRARLERRGVGLQALPLVAAGGCPTVAGKAAGGAAAALATAFLASGARGRFLAWALVLVVCVGLAAGVMAFMASPKPPVALLAPAPVKPRSFVEDIPRNRMRHDSSVQSVAYSRDGKMLASAGEVGTIKIWDA
jgi:RNA polymerase sigma factor (sigma-70 family)